MSHDRFLAGCGKTQFIHNTPLEPSILASMSTKHLEVILASTPYGKFQPCFWHQLSFSAACWEPIYGKFTRHSRVPFVNGNVIAVRILDHRHPADGRVEHFRDERHGPLIHLVHEGIQV